jgi:hypothetical protein
MTLAQQRNDELVALLGADFLPLTDRNLVVEFYYSGGDVSFAGVAKAANEVTHADLAE